MSPLDLSQAVRRRPFEPFRIQVSDGTTYDVRHPELVMIGLGSVSIGVPAKGQSDPIYERVETISLAHVVKLLPLTSQAGSTSNGQQG
ncbi:MAG TPA: hypothetical protein VKS79_01440 [Gemmataceae bacterium]|nr:hypothetical protein [Gemmataceae bacterium]